MRNRPTASLRSAVRGATLVEILIVVVLIGILGAWGSNMFSSNFATARMVDSAKTSADQVRYAMERMSREIREVKYTSLVAGYAITSTLAPSSSSVAFTRTIGGTDVTVTIARSGSTVTLGYSNGTTSTLANQVTAFTVDFYAVDPDTGAVSATTSAANVSYLVISLTCADALSGQSITERTRVTLRNG